MNMTGSFPEGIEHFPFLQSISFAYGELKGTVPKEIACMKHLVNVEAHFNSLHGHIPRRLWQSRNLQQRFNIAANQISGSIRPGIRDLKDAKAIYLFENLMTGKLPNDIDQLDSLAFI
jgi:hypothetical protein